MRFNFLRVSRWSIYALVVSSLLSYAMLASAQHGTATLRGTVLDTEGGAITNSHISAILQGSAPATRTATTGNAGDYLLDGLNPGTYQIKVETQGFKTVIVNGLSIAADDTQELKFTLETGSPDELITIDPGE
jgi:hypothetical protein